MLVRAKEACFIDGYRRRAGAEFDYKGTPLPAHLVPVGGTPPAAATAPDKEGPTKKELQAQLDAAGVKYAVNDTKDELVAALNAAKAKAAPAAATAPDKSQM
jgi:hypothetical protein